MGLSITDSVPNYCALGTEPERDLLKNGVSGQEWVLLEVVTPLNLCVRGKGARQNSDCYAMMLSMQHLVIGNLFSDILYGCPHLPTATLSG